MFQNILNEYILKDTIGKGSFSKVKLGINKITGEKVAIKILDKKKLKLNSERIRIQRELNIIKKLNHINIVKIFQIKEDTNNIYIIQEYIENNLFIHIINKKHFTEKESSFYFYQLIKGLEYLHSLNIVHRDLKPENILITKNKLLKIIDFGLSNYYNEKELLSTSCGSPSYTAPEVILGNKYNGFKADIWSIGIILYFMLYGYLPFEENNEINNSLFKKIIQCKIGYPKNISTNAKNILKKILVVDPKKRINISEIKKHQFYIDGKNLFLQKFPELIDKCQENNDINNSNTIPDGNDKNKLIINIQKTGPNFDLLKKILKGNRSNNNKNNKTENKINDVDNNKNNTQIKLLFKLNKEKEIYEKKYLSTEIGNNKNDNDISFVKKVKVNKNNLILHQKDKTKHKNKKYNKSLNLNNSIDIVGRTNYNYIYNNSAIILNKNNNENFNLNFYENNNSYTNRNTSKKSIDLKLKIKRKPNLSMIKYKIINSPKSLLNKSEEEKLKICKDKKESNLDTNRKKIRINGMLNKSERRRRKLSNISQIILFNYKNSCSYIKRKNKNEKDKYNIKEIIKRRGLDKIIKCKN